MSDRLLSLATALVIALISGGIGAVAFRHLSSEEETSRSVLAELHTGKNSFVVAETGGEKRCHGVMTATLTDQNGQFGITLTGWIALRVPQASFIQEMNGEMSFNPLGQLGASAITMDLNGTSFALGTVNINPITVKAIVGKNAQRPLLEQNIPGPIELHKSGDVYKLFGPAIATLVPLTKLASSAPKLPFTVSRDTDTDCTRENAQPIDFSGLVAHAQRLQGQIQSLLSGPVP